MIAAARGGAVAEVEERLLASRRYEGRRHRDQLGEFAEVLSGRGEVELVAGAARPAESEPIELQNTLQVSEQHLDLFALAARGLVLVGLGDLASQVTRTFVD